MMSVRRSFPSWEHRLYGLASSYWARNGSFLVFRRLQQDVATFNQFVENMAAEVGMNSDLLATKLIGRWKSGAPLIRVKEEDNPSIGNDEFTSNHLSYVNSEPAIKLT
ncbi:hypothetical protein GH884_23690 [Bacillus thuringiensis]|nr:hypothetical protein [Bacillus cereus]MRC31229.1 hypothetical protein [Bacillus thuringiensis]HDR8040795.1 hypothetical protein [Bacillus cereus]